ncbi:MAG: hypothetical protein SFV15_05995 [Polyangiaceae bacterium]|nr:hypothetical protein [Polyangiaceae bacterium]
MRLHARRCVNVVGLAFSLLGLACGSPAPAPSAYPETANKWFTRAQKSFAAGDMEDARDAVENALRVTPEREDARILAAKVALAGLEFDRVLQLLSGIDTSDARSLRGRALWYSLKIDEAADELELLLSDPEVRDPWAKEIAGLARRGQGRTPFEFSGGLLAVTEMPRVGGTSFLVPLELNGEQALAMIATGSGEAVVDASQGANSGFISLRFGERLEVRDVPAVARDLSGISREVNAPVKLLIGMNLLRHLHATVDFVGSQFVVRTFEPPPPPVATSVRLDYLRGGGMLVLAGLGKESTAAPLALLIDTAQSFPVALDAEGWAKTGTAPHAMKQLEGSPTLQHATLPIFKLGAFELPGVPGVKGVPMGDVEKTLGVNVDGVIGSGLLANFRITFADSAKTLWLEPLPMLGPEMPQEPAPREVGAEPSEAGKPAGAAPGAPPPSPQEASEPTSPAPTPTSPVAPHG